MVTVAVDDADSDGDGAVLVGLDGVHSGVKLTHESSLSYAVFAAQNNYATVRHSFSLSTAGRKKNVCVRTPQHAFLPA